MNSRTIRASEVGRYLYCRRAWWYQRQGVRSANVQELQRGRTAHDAHGRGVRRVAWQRGLAFALMGLAALLLLARLF